MTVNYEQRRAAERADTIGTWLIVLGCAGFLAAAVLTGWIIHDIDRGNGLGGLTYLKLETVTVSGLTPGMLSVLVVALGVHLQTKSTEMLFGAGVAWDEDDEDDDVAPE